MPRPCAGLAPRPVLARTHRITYRRRKSSLGLGIPGALLPIQTSPRLVMASHHSYLALQKMKGLRNAFIRIAVYIIMCLELSNMLLARPAGRCLAPQRAFAVCVTCAWGCRGDGPNWTPPSPDRCRSHSQRSNLHVHTPTTDMWLPGLEFCCSRVLFLMEGLCKMHTHLLLPSPSSSSFGGLWVRACAHFQLSPMRIIPSSTVPSSGEPEAGS